jgi:virulence factor Mce-like protein
VQAVKRIPVWFRLSAVAIVAALVVAGTIAAITSTTPSITVTAHFPTAPGLYAGNQVKVLGMPVGQVVRVSPGPTFVTVEMTVPTSTSIPRDAQAFLMAPQVVNDRYVEFNPAYTGGPRMQDHAVIPVARTAVPISVDGIINSLDNFAKALGPNGANANGALSSFISSSAHSFGGDGAALHATLTSLGQALGALSSKGTDLTALFDNLGNLSHVAAQYTQTYQAFANDLAVVSTVLASDNSDLGAALANLQQALGSLADFIKTNGSSLGTSVSNLESFAKGIGSNQQQLAQVFADLPVALSNLTQALDPNAPGGPALRSRFDAMTGSASFSASVCGNPLLRLLVLSVAQSQDNNPQVDLGCGVNGLPAAIPAPPGASTGPNLSIGALIGGAP